MTETFNNNNDKLAGPKRPTLSNQELSSLNAVLQKIARELGKDALVDNEKLMSEASYWRWHSSTNTGSPYSTTLIPILKHHSKLDKLNDIANFYGEPVKTYFMKAFPSMMGQFEDRAVDTKAKLLEDEYDYQIYFMCCNERGATVDEIVYTLGSIALKKLNINPSDVNSDVITSTGVFAHPKIEKLIQKEVIIKSDNFLKTTVTDTYIPEDRAIQESIKILANNIKPNAWDTGVNVFYADSQSIEPEIAIKASKVLADAFVNVSEMISLNKSNSKTAKPFLISVAGESLISSPDFGEKEIH
jgi:hypothetical protein